MEEHERIFKSYLRSHIGHLKELKMALANKDFEKAERLLGRLINITQKGIED